MTHYSLSCEGKKVPDRLVEPAKKGQRRFHSFGEKVRTQREDKKKTEGGEEHAARAGEKEALQYGLERIDSSVPFVKEEKWGSVRIGLWGGRRPGLHSVYKEKRERPSFTS